MSSYNCISDENTRVTVCVSNLVAIIITIITTIGTYMTIIITVITIIV